MCGIFGYIGEEDGSVALTTHRALCELEYRGYDSWGIAVEQHGEMFSTKAVGKISSAPTEGLRGVKGKMGIGHSRWATHGAVTEANAHPHFNHDHTIAVIHNGIIENHQEIRLFLRGKLGTSIVNQYFISETDTEVIPHLIDYFMVHEHKDFESAFVEAGRMLEGRFAVVVMKVGEPYLLAMRDGSPLVVGRGVHEFFLASDVPAFIDHTRTVLYPEDQAYVKVSHESVMMRELATGKKIDCVWHEVTWDKGSATKEGYPHFMLKEIMEQSLSLDKAIRQDDAHIEAFAKLMKESEHLFFIGCGTAAKMAKLGELYVARIAGKLATTYVGSEFGAYGQFLNKKSTIFAVSQSGETADVLEGLRVAKHEGARILSLLNVVGSSIDRMSKQALFLHAGPEIAVASTKAATAQIAVLILVAHALARKLPEGKHLLRGAVKDIKAWLTPDLSHELKKLAKTLVGAQDVYIIGRGLNAPIAQEAAIKIQEVSYIHAEGFPGGELKHGPIALIQSGTPVIALIANDETRRDMEGSTMELRSRGARIIGIAPEHSPMFDEWIRVPDLGLASPLASIIPIQLLAYHLAVLRGNDPDKPRNLAKSVTVK
jgi:glutamine---fructose-6-phosphate transaminase (isomerizing)